MIPSIWTSNRCCGAPRRVERRPRCRGLARWTAAFALGFFAGCGDPDPLQEDDPPPTFDEINERVLQVSCVFSTCHASGPSPAGILSLDRDVAYMNLVGISSSVLADQVLVVPGDPEASYVMEKLRNPMPASGVSMPPDAALDAERIALVRAWIEAGAADD